jgi:membrane associated rhomboid family serine protease
MSAPKATKEKAPTFADLGRELKLHGVLLVAIAAVMWAEEITDLFLGGSLDAFGIRPRSIDGLRGILFAPFLHDGFGHLAANTLPFFMLGWLVMLRRTWHFAVVSIVSALGGGLGTWMIGASNSVHVGASGMIFGYLGYLMLGGWFERSVGTIAASVLVTVVWGSLVFLVLPNNPGISWEGHLFGFISGALCAWLLARKPAKARMEPVSHIG